MPTIELTDLGVKSIRPGPQRIDYFDTIRPGLVLRVSPSGHRTWCVLYRVGGDTPSNTLRRKTLGAYPDLTLAKARKRAAADILKAQAGKDPGAEKTAARRAETFGELADAYLEVAKKRKRSWQEDERILNAELLDHWRTKKVRHLTRRDVRERIDAIAERAPVMANRVWALVSRIFNFAIEREWVDANPAARIARQPETSRDRCLSHDEIRALWGYLEDARILRRVGEPERSANQIAAQIGCTDAYVGRLKAEVHTSMNLPSPVTGKAKKRGPRTAPMIARGLQVLLLTAQRPGEVFRMRWEDLELSEDWRTDQAPKMPAWWTIPEAFSKNREAHRVPLTSGVLAILRECAALAPENNRWVFAGIAGGSVAARAKRAAAAFSKALGFAFHRHDLRRTAASEMAAAGIPRDTIAKVLNHVDRGARMTAVYDRYSYDAEKRVALETWARRLQAILEAKPGAVVPFVRAAV